MAQMQPSRGPVSPAASNDQKTERAIDALVQRNSAVREQLAPPLTSSSTGVMIHHARELVRKAN